jgi:hypothetical protein
MSRPRTSARDRPARARVWGCLAVLLWVLGVEVAPNLHLGLHDVLAPHTHGVAAHGEAEHDHEHWFELELDLDAHEHDDAADHDHAVEPVHEHGHDHGVEYGHDHGVGHDHAELADSGPHWPEFAGVRVAAGNLEHAAAAHDARVVAPARAIASRFDPDHGDHDLLHRGIAIACPPLAALSVAQAPVVVLARLYPRSDRPYTRALGRPRARGPPSPGSCRAVDCTA